MKDILVRRSGYIRIAKNKLEGNSSYFRSLQLRRSSYRYMYQLVDMKRIVEGAARLASKLCHCADSLDRL